MPTPVPSGKESVKVELWTGKEYQNGLTVHIPDGDFDQLVKDLQQLLQTREPTKIKLKSNKDKSTKSITVPYSPAHVKRVINETVNAYG